VLFGLYIALPASSCPCPVEPLRAPDTGAAGMHSGPRSERLDAESQQTLFLEDNTFPTERIQLLSVQIPPPIPHPPLPSELITFALKMRKVMF